MNWILTIIKFWWNDCNFVFNIIFGVFIIWWNYRFLKGRELIWFEFKLFTRSYLFSLWRQWISTFRIFIIIVLKLLILRSEFDKMILRSQMINWGLIILLFESGLILSMCTVFVGMSWMACIAMIRAVVAFAVDIDWSAISTFFAISNVSKTGVKGLSNFIEVSIINESLIDKSVLTFNHFCDFFLMLAYTVVSTFILGDWLEFQNNSIFFL